MRKRLLASVVAAGIAIGALVATPAFASETKLTGAGSSFANKYIVQCAVRNTSYSISYNPAGSGTGRTLFAGGTVQFAASDAASSISSGWGGSRGSFTAANYRYVPVVGGPIALLYNIPGVASGTLKLDAATVAKILSGKITKWNDNGIKSLQTAAVAAKLPAQTIRVVYRASSSGTSENLTNYLRQNVPSIWTRAKSQTIASANPAGRMPAGSIGAANSQALVTSVKSMKYTLGYADFSDTTDASGNPKVSVALLKNANGEFIAPSSDSASTFLAVFSSKKYFNTATGAVTLDYTKVIPGAYQASLLTYALVDKAGSASYENDVKTFVTYLLNGCDGAAAQLGYSPIGGALKTAAQAIIDQM